MGPQILTWFYILSPSCQYFMIVSALCFSNIGGMFILQCLELCSISEHLIQDSKDTLTIQPAWLDIATVRKKPEEELGMHIQSSYNGTHTIGGIKEESPAHQCGKVEEGDEVIMVRI